MRKFIASAILMTLAPLSGAQQEVPEVAAGDVAPRQYAVEVIIFEYKEDVSVGSEVFVPELIEESDDIPVFEDVPVIDDGEEAPNFANIRMMTEDEFSMRESYGRLQRLQAYEPLMYFGWVQDTIPDEETESIPLETFSQPPEGLEGSVSLNLSRYLHLGVDLTLDAENYVPPSLPGYEESDQNGGFGSPDSRRAARYAPLKYELRETRIMKNGDVRYYDHPKFGVVAKVWRIESGM